jgi:hypothetical protein
LIGVFFHAAVYWNRNAFLWSAERGFYFEPTMGVISYRCRKIGEVFLGISTDTRSSFNSNNMKLAANGHPNKRLQQLWNQFGPEGFELSVIKVLKYYDDPNEDHTEKLERLREECLAADPNARRIWR